MAPRALLTPGVKATAEGDKLSVAGAVTFLDLQHTAEATIKTGARINQNRTDYYTAGTQAVVVDAKSINEGVHLGGNLKLPGIKGDVTDFKFDPQTSFALGSTTADGKGGSGVGFTFLMTSYSNTVTAKIENGVRLKADSLTVNAETLGMSITVGASGGES